MREARPPATDIVLLTEIYPPAIGGTAVLWNNVYGRVTRFSVAVVTDRTISPGEDDVSGRVKVYRRDFLTRRWGVLSPGALRDHLRTIRALHEAPFHRNTLVHCSRTLPEGVSTALSLFGRSRYLCWAHGEELTTATQSREFAFLTKHTLARAAAVFANSVNTRTLLENIGIPRNHIAVAYPAVDPVRFNPDVPTAEFRRRYAPNGEILLVIVARLERRKGHDHAIQALAKLRHDYPQVRLLIVGDGEERQRLESMVKDFGVADRVTFTGKVAEADLPAYHALADVFLHPNRIHETDTEGFGIVFLEAQASGKPVVGGSTGGVPETMIPGQTGLLVSGEDVDETAAVLRQLIDDEPLRKRMGAAGRQHVSKTFSWDAAAKIVEDTHAHVLKYGSLARG